MPISWPWRRARSQVDPNAEITTEVALQVLREAGWFPGRVVDVSAWIARLEGDGYSVHPAGQAFLRQFGGLDVRKYRLGFLFSFDPTDLFGLHDRIAEFESEEIGPLFPVGILPDNDTGLVVDSAGELIAICEDGYGRLVFRFGRGIDGVVNMMLDSKEVVRIDPGEDEYVQTFPRDPIS